MIKEKNILIIIQHLYGGGAERVAADLGEYLRIDNNVLLVTFDSTHDSAYEYNGKLLCLDLISKYRILKPIVLLRRIHRIRIIKKERKIDYSISFLRNANILNVLSRRREKCIVSIRNNLDATTKYFDRVVEKYICNKADRVVTLSNGVRGNLINILDIKPEKVKTVFNMCDPNRLFRHNDDQQLKKLSQQIDGKYCIFSCGSFRYQKGQWHLLNVFKLVHDACPNTALVLFGEGQYRDELINLSKKLQIAEDIYMPGYVKGYHTLMREHGKIFCFTSIYEGFGNVLLEAMACGNAVVCTDCNYGPAEILCGNCINNEMYVTTTCGILTPAFPFLPAVFSGDMCKEEKIMADAIIYLIKNENVRRTLVEGGFERLKDFSPGTIINDWSNTLTEL